MENTENYETYDTDEKDIAILTRIAENKSK
jgi:hypothetical protein